MTPEYFAIGHVAKDMLAEGRFAPGGTVTYSALAAQRLGLQAAVVTSCAPSDSYLLDALRDEGVLVHIKPSQATTTFSNIYDRAGNRTQVLSAQAGLLSYSDVPEGWLKAPIVHLGPIAQELPGKMPTILPGTLLGVTPQGWMRRWDAEGRVTQSAQPVPPALNLLPRQAILILSMEDLGHNADLVALYSKLAPLVVVTGGGGPALIYSNGEQLESVPSRTVESVDPTGAGDVFATAFLVRYRETEEPVEATRFAHAVAARAIMGQGTSSIPRRDAIG